MAKNAGLTDFKAHLSQYVRAAARGQRLVVTYRGRPLVEVREAPPGAQAPLVAAGFLPARRPGARRWADRGNYGLTRKKLLRPGRVQALLDEERNA